MKKEGHSQMNSIQAAIVQFTGSENKPDNVEKAIRFIGRAAKSGADLVVLPEYFNFLGRKELYPKAAESIPGPTIDTLREVARGQSVAIVCGSIPEVSGTPGKVKNSSVFVSDTGELLAKYSKIHLFDIDVPGEVSYLESESVEPGRQAVTCRWKGITFGLSICYDIRFPELYRRLMQENAQVILICAAFTKATGHHHWQSLIRSRAIENQVFICAANQWGDTPNWLPTFGHSAIIDPWGRTLCEIPDGEGMALAEIDLDELARIRSESPILNHIQPWLFRDLGANAKE
jgi:predicted amidohydrolase